MKSKNLQRIIILGILFLFPDQVWAEDWTYYDTSLAGTMYYDKSSIFEAKKGILSVWTKNILSTDSKKQYYAILKKMDKAPDDPSKLSYYKSLMEIDRTNKKFRYVYAVFYDEQDNIIYPSSEDETSAWNAIEPDSVGEKLMNLVSAESVPPKETVVAPKATQPLPAKETAVDEKVDKPVPRKETVVKDEFDKPVYPKETVLAAKILESIPSKESVAAAKVETPAPMKEKAIAALKVPDKKLTAVKNNQQDAKAIPEDGNRKTGLKEEDRQEPGEMATGRKTGTREIQDQKGKLPDENRPGISATTRETARDGRFIAFDNQTVLDTKTNLIWAAKDNGQDINWYNAKRYCESYRGGSYTDWRMPTQEELAQLYDAGKSQRHDAQQNPLHLTELIRLTDCCPWSSKTRGSESAYFDFTDGTHWWFVSPGTNINRALPVRSAK
ncbi:MAG TPA: DUF1566 domain-containing protein [Smithellaceae bacterium]|jgi:hypothetical protein|nr:DUF1566 domain-containing protein [Smithellaceae bacterium]